MNEWEVHWPFDIEWDTYCTAACMAHCCAHTCLPSTPSSPCIIMRHCLLTGHAAWSLRGPTTRTKGGPDSPHYIRYMFWW